MSTFQGYNNNNSLSHKKVQHNLNKRKKKRENIFVLKDQSKKKKLSIQGESNIILIISIDVNYVVQQQPKIKREKKIDQ